GSRAVLRGSHEREQHRRFPDGYRLALVAGPQAPQPDAPSVVGTDGAIHRPVASTRAYLSPLSPRPLRRCHPRQEPDAVMPHVRICGGGYEQSSSLLRLLLLVLDLRLDGGKKSRTSISSPLASFSSIATVGLMRPFSIRLTVTNPTRARFANSRTE